MTAFEEPLICGGCGILADGSRGSCATCQTPYASPLPRALASGLFLVRISGGPESEPRARGFFESLSRLHGLITSYSGTKPLEDIERVPIDRCAEHGLWFDPSELLVMLERASGQFEPRGVRAWLEKLFNRRDTPRAD